MTLKVFQNYTKSADADVVSLGLSVVSKLPYVACCAKPPVDLSVLQADLEKYSGKIVESRDGSKQVIAEKKNLRKSIIKRLRLLGHFVEVMCDGDPAAVAATGYQPVVVTRKAPQQVLTPAIAKVDHGVFGQLLVWIVAVAKAASYEIRFAPVTGGTVGSWATVPTTTVKSAVPVDGLTPGTQYMFQVRALGRLGYSDWSDAANCICT